MPIGKQVGNTCQYFTLMNLMETLERGALTSTDFKNCIGYCISNSPNPSGFIATYCNKPKVGTTTSLIGSFDQMVVGTHYYVDNGVHAVCMTKSGGGNIAIWNPQLGTEKNYDIEDGRVTTNNQTYPNNNNDNNLNKFDVWQLKDVLDGTTGERNRQIAILNAISTFMTTYTTADARTTNLAASLGTGNAGLNMTVDEKKAVVMALVGRDSKKYKIGPIKLAMGVQ